MIAISKTLKVTNSMRNDIRCSSLSMLRVKMYQLPVVNAGNETNSKDTKLKFYCLS